ncbi:MAG: histidinol dehydrogenase, partial [Planctomycetales bacterium]|nr:histidinol dehydrogenase [Planctomycetales bacterium]
MYSAWLAAVRPVARDKSPRKPRRQCQNPRCRGSCRITLPQTPPHADKAACRRPPDPEIGLRQGWKSRNAQGGTIGEKFDPFQRVGIYIPGGTAPLVSTALMTVVLARVA